MLIVVVVVALEFLYLGKHPISPWDEARTGVNAIEMLNNHDWVNCYYSGQPDGWQVKPPLGVWAVAASFSLFGFNEFALRLPSACSMVGAFLFLFILISLFRSASFAMWVCLILASVKGLIGWHVGRTGDFDAMLVFFLIGGLYFFLKAHNQDFEKIGNLILAALFWGLAFLVKGPAAGVLFPGLVLFLSLERKLWTTLKKYTVWLAISLFLLFPIGWFSIQYFYGNRYSETDTGSTAFDRMFIQDLVVRFTKEGDGWKSSFSPDFFFYSLDKSFNLWNYVFFLVLLFGIYWTMRDWKKVKETLRSKYYRLLLLSLCLYFPLAIFLTIAAKSNRWYLAPVLPFVGIATYWGIDYFKRKNKFTVYAFLTLLMFTLIRRGWEILHPQDKPSFIVENTDKIKSAETVYLSGVFEQDVLLYLYFLKRDLKFNEPFKMKDKVVWIQSNNSKKYTLHANPTLPHN